MRRSRNGAGPTRATTLVAERKAALAEGSQGGREASKGGGACGCGGSGRVAEANAVLERQAARPDATAAILTSVLLKRGGTASPEVVARTRAKRDSLKAAEMRARKPVKAMPKERNAAERLRTDGDLTDARLAAALLLQRCARTWLRCRKKLRRKQRSRAAKLIQRSVRTWLLAKPHSASSGGDGAITPRSLSSCPSRPGLL